MTALQIVLFLMVAGTGAAVAFAHEPRRQIWAMGTGGVALALLFLVLQAPDVAFAMIAVGGAAVPALFLVAIASVRVERQRKGESGESGE